MPVGMMIWLACCGVVGLVWASRQFAVVRAIRHDRRLRPDSHGPLGKDAPRLSVLVSAKDEEDNIEACIESLLRQDYPNLEIIAINDRSDDRTGEILDQMQRKRGDLVQAVHVSRLTEGWFGKNHAMHTGMKYATGEWLCFIDADCKQTSDKTLSMAMQEALSRQADFLSVLPVLETKTFWERLIQPICAAILVIWFDPEKVNNPKCKAAYANGAFMMMSRKAYQKIGGHTAVKTELNEDICMARLAKDGGLKLFVIQNDGLYLTRMYASFKEAWRGWSRIFFGTFRTYRRLFATLGLVLSMSVFPFISLIVAITGLMLADEAARSHWWIALGVTGAVVLMLEIVIFQFMRLVRAANWAWITYFFGVLLGVGMLVMAIRKAAGASTTWRGTTYQSDQSTKPADQPDVALSESPMGGVVESRPVTDA
ncbi:MAG: glycosyltransferase [Phycisphaerales bacterium]|nr:glycosyltransferase [Phycisphaerales bacterium]